jgi:hypothetical protein
MLNLLFYREGFSNIHCSHVSFQVIDLFTGHQIPFCLRLSHEHPQFSPQKTLFLLTPD